VNWTQDNEYASGEQQGFDRQGGRYYKKESESRRNYGPGLPKDYYIEGGII